MDTMNSYIALVKQAQSGDEKCMNLLARLARERLSTHVHRLVFTDDLTQDILQESLLEMFRSIGKLQRADRFWPWLFKIAGNKVNHHYKQEHRRRTVPLSEIDYYDEHQDRQEDVADMVSQELKQSVMAAMHELKPTQRNVLFLRCYEGLKYSEIAEAMGCTEIGAQMRFLRAKKALTKELSRCGLGRGSLLMGLILFGKLTAPSKAAVAQIAVTAATTKVGLAASAAALVTSKTAIVSLVAAGALTGGTMVATSGTDDAAVTYSQSGAKSSYVTVLSGQSDKGSEKIWYYYPSRANGALMLRVKSGAGDKHYSLCLQNDKANYRQRGNTTYINNDRVWHEDLAVWRLPTDSPQLTNFLSLIEGRHGNLEYVSNDGGGLLVMAQRDENDNLSQATQRQDVLDKEFFRYDWPIGTKIVDNRDTMHKRGWTYFEMTGQINGKQLNGAGRIPFIYATSQDYYPWLNLQMAGASIEDADSFRGLSRPWMGLHTIDTVRRDAAEMQIPFETAILPDGSKGQVTLTYEHTKLIYTIDMGVDVIDRITFLSDTNETVGQLEFSYMQDIKGASNKFAAPRNRSYQQLREKSGGIGWLFELIPPQGD